MKLNSNDKNPTTDTIVAQTNNKNHIKSSLFEITLNRQLNIQNKNITETIIDSDGLPKHQIRKTKISGENYPPIRKYNSIRRWNREKASVIDLANHIRQGFAITPALYKANAENITEKSIEGFWGLCLDFDDHTAIEDSLKLVYVCEYANIAYKSPSWSEQKPKHRIVIVYPRKVTVAEQKAVYRWAKCAENYGSCDHSSFNETQYFNGCRLKDDDAVIVLNENVNFPIDLIIALGNDLLESDGESSVDSGVIENEYHNGNENDNEKNEKVYFTTFDKTENGDQAEDETITTKILRDINERITNAIHNGDKTKLYSELYDHRFNNDRGLSRTDKESGILDKWEGYNPFSVTNATGTSFVISEKDKSLPMIWSIRSGDIPVYNAETGKHQHGGTFIDYFYLLNVNDYGDLSDTKEFKTLVTDIYKRFGVEPFKFRGRGRPRNSENIRQLKETDLQDQIDLIELSWNDYIKPNFFLCMWESKEKLYFVNDGTIWRYVTTKTIDTVLARHIKRILGMSENAIINQKIFNYCMLKIKSGCLEPINQPFDPVDYYIPFKNGAFNLLTKRLEPYEDLKIYNVTTYNFDYEHVADGDEEIEAINRYWSLWLNDENKAQTWIKWLILNAQQQAHKTGKVVGFIGEAGGGKSTAGKFIKNVVGIFAGVEDADNVFNDNNRFSYQCLGEYTSLILEEFSGNSKICSMKKLKKITGHSDGNPAKVKIEKKGFSPVETMVKVAITFDSEKRINIFDDDKGSYRRIVFFVIKEESKNKELWNNYSYLIQSPEKTRKYLFWALQQDTHLTMREFMESLETETFKEETQHIKIENDPIYDFCEDKLIVTTKGTHRITNEELYEVYKKWCSDSGVPAKKKIGRNNYKSDIERCLKEYFGWKPELNTKGEKLDMWKENNNVYKGLTNAILRDNDLERIENLD
jgi:phage/plasmid-associated DNA primase